jgi:hypothetical protein
VRRPPEIGDRAVRWRSGFGSQAHKISVDAREWRGEWLRLSSESRLQQSNFTLLLNGVLFQDQTLSLSLCRLRVSQACDCESQTICPATAVFERWLTARCKECRNHRKTAHFVKTQASSEKVLSRIRQHLPEKPISPTKNVSKSCRNHKNVKRQPIEVGDWRTVYRSTPAHLVW